MICLWSMLKIQSSVENIIAVHFSFFYSMRWVKWGTYYILGWGGALFCWNKNNFQKIPPELNFRYFGHQTSLIETLEKNLISIHEVALRFIFFKKWEFCSEKKFYYATFSLSTTLLLCTMAIFWVKTGKHEDLSFSAQVKIKRILQFFSIF